MSQSSPSSRPHPAPLPHPETHPGAHTGAGKGLAGQLNWLRAAVLGANDGIISTAGMVLGVAGASSSPGLLLTAALAALVAGALSMAAGEYVSVSTQRDSEKAAVHMEQQELHALPQAELQELAALLQQKGMQPATAWQAACEITAHDALAAHSELELGIRPGDYTNPWHAAGASALAFTAGALVPLLALWLAPAAWTKAAVVVAVVMALACTGWLSAVLGQAPRLRAMARTVAGGVLTMGLTYALGCWVGAAL